MLGMALSPGMRCCGVGIHHWEGRQRHVSKDWCFTRRGGEKEGEPRRRRSMKQSLNPFSPASSSLRLTPPASLSTAFDAKLLHASANSSFKLIAVCAFVVWMQKSGQLPAEAPSILSQVSYHLLIPCFLMSKVIETITSTSGEKLIILPTIAVIQVLVGILAGKLACRIMYGNTNHTIAPSLPIGEQTFVEAQGEKSLSYVESTNSRRPEHVAPIEALIVAACAFGNSLTLPLVFLSGILSPEDFNTATGYLALFTAGWSPCLWSLGYQIIHSTNSRKDVRPAKYKSTFQFSVEWFKQFLNPPLYGVLMGLLIGGTPLSYLFFPARESQPSTLICTKGVLYPIIQGAALLGSATLAIQTVVLASSLANSVFFASQKDKKRKRYKDSQLPEGTIATNDIGGLEISLEPKAFWIIFLMRLLFMPLVGLILTRFFQQRRWLPSDPLAALAVLVESAMPTAQNLVVLAQLEPSTRPLAGILAELLMKQYVLSLIPLTMWMTIFLGFLQAR